MRQLDIYYVWTNRAMILHLARFIIFVDVNFIQMIESLVVFIELCVFYIQSL